MGGSGKVLRYEGIKGTKVGGGRLEVVDSRLEVGKWEGGKVGGQRA